MIASNRNTSKSFLRLQSRALLALLFFTKKSYSMEQHTKYDQDHISSLPPTYQVPSFTVHEMQSGEKDNELKNILTSTGLLTIRVPTIHRDDEPKSSSNDNNLNFLEGFCKCHSQDIAQIANGDSRLLADGFTTRSTIATASRGQQLLSLPKSDITKYCGEGIHESLEKVRDYVSSAATDTFIPALDRLIQAKIPTKLYEEEKQENPPQYHHQQHLIKTRGDDKKYYTVSSIIEDANHLEHFHSYSKAKHDSSHERTAVDSTLDWHTDGGLFLAFVPGKSCNDNRDVEDDSFRVSLPNGGDKKTNTEMRAIFPQSVHGEIVVVIMLGVGAEHWLNTPDTLKLRATRHAVKMKGGDRRVWYGMMHLVPSKTIVQHKPFPQTFAEMKKSSIHSTSRKFGKNSVLQENEIVIGCGNDDTSSDSTMYGINTIRRNNRRLQHVGGQEDCEGSSNYFCWLSCLDKPNGDHSIDHHVTNGESLYCLDPSVLDTTGDIALAVRSCSDPKSGKAGGVMNEACANYWYPTVDGVETYLQSVEKKTQSIENKYCYGATAMYMQGFEWEGTTCIVFLFTSWILSTRFALIGACLGTILLGVLTEMITHHRRSFLKKIEGTNKKVLASGLLYAGQVTMGYTIMLVVMTYSIPLVLSVIFGLGLGHVLTNWKVKKDIVIEGSTPCCQYMGDEQHDNDDSTAESDKGEVNNTGVV